MHVLYHYWYKYKLVSRISDKMHLKLCMHIFYDIGTNTN